MLPKGVTSLAFAASCLAAAAMPGAAALAASPHRAAPAAWHETVATPKTPAQNIRASQRYTRMVATSPGFREARMNRECSPITDPALHQSCIASFHQEVADWHAGNTSAFYGSSAAELAPTSAGD
jgi:hypothetical protein